MTDDTPRSISDRAREIVERFEDPPHPELVTLAGLLDEIKTQHAQALRRCEAVSRRRLRERDAARAQIDALRSALGCKTGEALELDELIALAQAVGVHGDAAAAFAELRELCEAAEDARDRLADRLEDGTSHEP